MIRSALWKNILREIKDSITRYFSIVAMVMIGVFVLVGLMTVSPMMHNTAVTQVKKENMADLMVESTFGLDENDQRLLGLQTDVKDLQYGYRKDLKTSRDHLVRVISYPEDVSVPVVIEGREPRTSGEILLDIDMKDKGYDIGGRVRFRKETDKFKMDEDVDDMDCYHYHIVGFCESLEFMERGQKGTSLVGPGQLDGFGYVCKNDFNLDDYSYAQMTLKEDVKKAPYGDVYHEALYEFRNELKEDFKPLRDQRYDDIREEIIDAINEGEMDIDDAYRELDDAERQIEDAKEKLAQGERDYLDGLRTFNSEIANAEQDITDAEEELRNAKTELDDAKAEIDEGREELEEGRQEMEDGIADYEAGKEQYEEGLADYRQGVAEIEAGWQEYRAGLAELETNKEKIEDGLAALPAAEEELRQAKRQLDASKAQVEEGLAKLPELRQGIQDINDGLEQLDQAEEGLAGLAEINAGISEVRAGINQINEAIAAIDEQLALLDPENPEHSQYIDELTARKAEYEAKKQNLEQTLAELQAQKAALETQLGGITQVQIDAQRAELKSKLVQANNAIEQIEAGKAEYDQGLAAYYDGVRELEAARAELEAGKAEIEQAEVELKDARRELEAGEAELEEAKAELDQVAAQLAEAESDVNAAKADFAEAEAEFEKGYNEWKQGKDDYDQGIKDIAEAKETLEEERESGLADLREARQELNESRADIEEAEAEFKREKADALEKIEDAEEELDSARDTLRRLNAPQYTFTGRVDQPLFVYFDNAKRVVYLSYIFPLFMFFIAMLVSLTTMTRMVNERRTEMGTLKALGYSKWDNAKKFLVYGGTASIIGGIIGIITGHLILAPMIAYAYSSSTILSDAIVSFYPGVSILAFVLGFLSTAGVAMIIVRRSMNETAANLMRPKAPKSGTRIFLERLTPIWKRMSFFQKVTARNIFRYKKRLFMTVFGIMGCTALLFLGFGIRESVEEITIKQYGELTTFDLISIYDEDYGEKAFNEYIELLDTSSDIDAYTDVVYQHVVTENPKGNEQSISVIVPLKYEGFDYFVTLRDRPSGESIALEEGKVVVTEKMARLKDLDVGDTFTFEDDDGETYKAEISAIAEAYAGHFMYMTASTYEKIFDTKADSNAHLLEFTTETPEEHRAVIEEIMAEDVVMATVDFQYVKDITNTYVESLDQIVYILVIVSTMLAIIVLYNLTNINIAERMRELSTLKVLGFYNREMTTYIYRETWVITAMSIVLGFGAGIFLHRAVLLLTPPDDAMFNPVAPWQPYVYSAIITLIITYVVQHIVAKKLKNINMVEALKSVE